MAKSKTAKVPDAKPEIVDISNKPSSGSKLQKVWKKFKGNKKIAIPVTIVAIIGLVLLIPITRYQVLGLFIQKNFNVMVVDSATGRPVSSAAIYLAGQTAQTDNDGKATLHAKLGKSKLTAEKSYYNTAETNVTVTLTESKNNTQVSMVATGRTVPVSVKNKITSEPVSNATIQAEGTEVKTTADGKALIVLPVDKERVQATVKGEGYNETKVQINVTDQEVDSNAFSVTPTGKVYFLSKKSGKYDVVKTNLDGTDRKVVVKGTGKEDDSTELITTRDWKYLVLHARRDSKQAKLYLIDTSSDKLSVIDEGDASFDIHGWANHHLVYTVYRNNVPHWKSKHTALKSFNAEDKKLTTIDENQSVGKYEYDSSSENFSNIAIVDSSRLIYAKFWNYTDYYSDNLLKGKKSSIIAVNADGGERQILKEYSAGTVAYMEVLQPKPQQVYMRVETYKDKYNYTYEANYYIYDHGTFKNLNIDDDVEFYEMANVDTHILPSPDGKSTFWYERRDGKNSFFIGNENADKANEVTSVEGYIPFGWYTDQYLLATLKESELYVMPRTGGSLLKFTDFQQSAGSYPGYNHGYGN